MSGAANEIAAREALRARLNLWAVLPNLEDLVCHDPEMAALVRSTHITVHLGVRDGPSALVQFADGVCTVGRAPTSGLVDADVALWFASCTHLNRMFDGRGTTIPLRGFSKLSFVRNEFERLINRMVHYLRPTDELLADPGYLAMNTRLTLNMAVFAVPVLLEHDPYVWPLRETLANGSVVLKVMTDGLCVGLLLESGEISPVKGEIDRPTAVLQMRDLQTANAFLNGKLDTYTAVARGDIEIWGHIPKADALTLVLERIPLHLS